MQLIARADDLIGQVTCTCLLDAQRDRSGARCLFREGANLDENRNPLVEVDTFSYESDFSRGCTVDDSTVKLILLELLAGAGVLGGDLWLLVLISFKKQFVGFFALIFALCDDEHLDWLKRERINFHF